MSKKESSEAEALPTSTENADEHLTAVSKPKKKGKKKAKKSTATSSDLPAALMSKADAVRATIKAGITKPVDAVAHIKKKYGLEIGSLTFSSYKSQLSKKSGKKRLKGCD